MKVLWRWAVGAAATAVVLVIGFIIGQGTSFFNVVDFGRGEYLESTESVIESIRDLSTLTTVEVVEYTTIEKGDDRGVLNWAVGDRVFMFAVARIGAGVDLGMLTDGDVDLDFDDRTAVLRLPPASISFIALDNEATQVFDRDTGLFTGGDPRLESDARAAAETILRDAAVEHGILDTAEAEAERALRSFLSSLRVRLRSGGTEVGH